MDKELSLLMDLYELTMGMSYFTYKRNAWATFDLLSEICLRTAHIWLPAD